MKTIKQLFMLLALVGVVATSCKKDEETPKDPFDTLDFQVSPEDAGINERVEFSANNTTLGSKYEYKLVSEGFEETVVANNGVASYNFDTEGTYIVTLTVDGRLAKPEHMVDVSASNYKSAKKLYVSTLTNIFEVDMSAEVLEAVDTDLKAGTNALTVKWANDKLFIFEAGLQVGWSGYTDYDGDEGSIKTFDPASFTTTTLITFTKKAYDDAFYGYVDDNNVYWADRNFDISAIPVDSQDKVFKYDPLPNGGDTQGQYNDENDYPPMITSTMMADMFGIQTYAYNGGFEKVGNQWFIAKNSHESGGLYIVNDNDGTYTADRAILTEYNISTFAVVGDQIFFVDNREKGLNPVGVYVTDLGGEEVKLIDGSVGKQIASSDVHATIIADEEEGYVYWTYRADTGLNPDDKSGIKAFPIAYSDDDDLSDEVALIVEVAEPLGIALAPVYE
ncbi:MAG: hypothetical protein KAH10_05280 [Flavobacteriales bacterium]|nr:hypothetical protein [Flavobacteriales bacterium]